MSALPMLQPISAPKEEQQGLYFFQNPVLSSRKAIRKKVTKYPLRMRVATWVTVPIQGSGSEGQWE
jgi:hypothetical protein